MTDFNSEAYIKDQIKKQYHTPPESKVKHFLEGSPYPMDSDLMARLIQADIASLQGLIKEGQATYQDLAKACYNQVLAHQDYNAVIHLNQDIVDQAKNLRYDSSHSPLYGIPLLVKDNIGTKDLPTTAGAGILKDFYCDDDAHIIQQVKKEGALILGKTNLSEWANFMTTESANGYSAIGGQTKNAHGAFDVGGSSAGSGVALALHMAPLALGTETAGSIIYPASQNGLVGLKPSLGRISKDRIIPLSKSYDTPGPMARTLPDAYHLFAAMTTIKKAPKWDRKDLKGLRIGIVNNQAVTDYYRMEDPDLLQQAKNHLEQRGAKCQFTRIDPPAFDVDVYPVLKHDFRSGIQSYFSHYRSFPLSLEDIQAFNQKDLATYAPYGQDIIEEAVKDPLSETEAELEVIKHRDITQNALDKAFEDYDILMTLSNYCTVLYATAGYPALTLPKYKRPSGEPVGVTFFGPAQSDCFLMEVGHVFML